MPLGQFNEREFRFANEGDENFTAGAYNQLGYSMNGNGQNVFTDWLFPQTKEARQYAMQLEMDENEPSARMEGLKRAGINPLTAAAGIAGSGSSNLPQPASSTNPIGDVAGAAGALAGGYGAIAAGDVAYKKVNSEIDDLKASAASKFAGIGLTNAQTQGVLTDNKYKDEDWKATLNVKRQQFENMKQEWNNIKATHAEIMKRIDDMQASIELKGSQQEYYESMHQRIDEENRFIKAKNDFCLANKLYLLDSGIDGYIFSMVESGASMEQFDRFIEAYSEYREQVSYAHSKGMFQADADTAWERFKNQAEGTDFGRLIHGKDLADLENYKALFDVMCQLYFGSGSTETALLSKIFNLAATMFNLDVNDVRRMFFDATNPNKQSE